MTVAVLPRADGPTKILVLRHKEVLALKYPAALLLQALLVPALLTLNKALKLPAQVLPKPLR